MMHLLANMRSAQDVYTNYLTNIKALANPQNNKRLPYYNNRRRNNSWIDVVNM